MNMETILEPPVLTQWGVLQTIRKYDYDKNIVVIQRTFNGQVVSEEKFYLD